MENNVLDFTPETKKVRRRELLPWWIKMFIWIFMVFGIISLVGIIAAAIGFSFQLEMYGIKTSNPRTLAGMLVIGIFMFKGVVAYGLWTEKDWAVKSALIDGLLGLILCVLVIVGMNFPGSTTGSSFRLEILFILPYLYKMQQIKPVW